MSEVGFALFDADNHYYEAVDAFTRHMDPKLAKRGVQWGVIDGKTRILDLQPTGLHQRVAVVLGSKNEVERVASYHRK